MSGEEDKLEELERKLDDALVKVYELEARLKTEASVRFEFEEMLRSIYYESQSLKGAAEQPDGGTLLANLSANIERLFADYKIKL